MREYPLHHEFHNQTVKAPKESKSRSLVLMLSLTYDPNYWTSGCININIHSKELEIEFLCFGFYIGKS